MRVVVIEPALPAVTLEEAARHLRLDGDEEREYVEGLIAAAQMHIDGPSGWLGRAIGLQTLEMRADCWPGCIPYTPVIEIVSVTSDGEAVEGVGVEPDGVLIVPVDLSRPSADLRIRYRAGYGRWQGEGEDRELVAATPAPIRAAILLMVGDLYWNRETVAEGTRSSIQMSTTVENLLAPYRVWLL